MCHVSYLCVAKSESGSDVVEGKSTKLLLNYPIFYPFLPKFTAFSKSKL